MITGLMNLLFIMFRCWLFFNRPAILLWPSVFCWSCSILLICIRQSIFLYLLFTLAYIFIIVIHFLACSFFISFLFCRRFICFFSSIGLFVHRFIIIH